MGITTSSVLSPDTIHSTALQAVLDLEPTIVVFKKKYAETQESATDLISRASSLTAIVTDEDRELANELMRQSAAGKKAAEETCGDLKGQTHKLWKSFVAVENTLLAEFSGVRTRLEPLALAYDRKQETERLKAEQEAFAAAQEAAVDDILHEAIQREAEGDTEGSEALLDAPVSVAPVYTMPAPKMGGESKTIRYAVEVTDLMELVKSVAEGKTPLCALEANMSFLKAQANSLKTFYAIPGTSAKPEDKLRIRA